MGEWPLWSAYLIHFVFKAPCILLLVLTAQISVSLLGIIAIAAVRHCVEHVQNSKAVTNENELVVSCWEIKTKPNFPSCVLSTENHALCVFKKQDANMCMFV